MARSGSKTGGARGRGKTGRTGRTGRKAPLTAKTNQRRNTRGGRAKMARSSFALPQGTGSKPGQAQYRMDTLAHARNARARVAQFGTASERRTVNRKTAAKYPSLKG